MIKEKDFDNYSLESLLSDSKHKIDIADPEKDTLINSTLETLRSIKRFSLTRNFENKWMMHGLTENLKDSFAPQFESLGISVDMMKKPKTLKTTMLNRTMDDVRSFCDVIKNSEYMSSLTRKLRIVEVNVLQIFLDEQTTYEHVDVVTFSKTKIHGFSQENFARKLKGIQVLLGAFNTFTRDSYEENPIRQSMEWHLLQAGFSFDGQMVVAPKDDDVVVSDTLENLGWTPAKVHDLNATLDSVLTMERNISVLPNVLPEIGKVEDAKMTATLVENCYNVRNIMSYVKNTLYVMCNQYLRMVRSYQ